MDYNNRHFDYIIVGAGPSAVGLVLGLLEHHDTQSLPSIAVIERGNRLPASKTMDLSQWYPAAHENSSSTRLASTSIMGRVLDVPMGQGLGGSSNINAGLVMPPCKDDWEKWPEPWASLLPSAVGTLWQRLQATNYLQPLVGSSTPLKGSNGWDIKWGQSVATFEEQMAGGSKQRRTYYHALLEDHRQSNSVEWIVGTQVERLLVRDKVVKGVECSADGGIFWYCYADKAVILCAGAIESPALLLASGIGPELGTSFQGVGRHLQDQLLIPRVFLTSWQAISGKLSSNGFVGVGLLCGPGQRKVQIMEADCVSHDPIIPAAGAMVIRRNFKAPFLRKVVEVVFGITECTLRLLVRWTPLGYFLRHYTKSFMLFLMDPRSEGSIQINPERSKTYRPLRRQDCNLDIEVGYGRDPRDLAILQEAWHSLGPPSGFYDLVPKVGLNFLCRNVSLPYFHFIGTCAMKRDDYHLDWVVEAEDLSLREHKGLYVCDASVFPAFVSVPPALTCSSLGYAFGLKLQS